MAANQRDMQLAALEAEAIEMDAKKPPMSKEAEEFRWKMAVKLGLISDNPQPQGDQR